MSTEEASRSLKYLGHSPYASMEFNVSCVVIVEFPIVICLSLSDIPHASTVGDIKAGFVSASARGCVNFDGSCEKSCLVKPELAESL